MHNPTLPPDVVLYHFLYTKGSKSRVFREKQHLFLDDVIDDRRVADSWTVLPGNMREADIARPGHRTRHYRGHILSPRRYPNFKWCGLQLLQYSGNNTATILNIPCLPDGKCELTEGPNIYGILCRDLYGSDRIRAVKNHYRNRARSSLFDFHKDVLLKDVPEGTIQYLEQHQLVKQTRQGMYITVNPNHTHFYIGARAIRPVPTRTAQLPPFTISDAHLFSPAQFVDSFVAPDIYKVRRLDDTTALLNQVYHFKSVEIPV